MSLKCLFNYYWLAKIKSLIYFPFVFKSFGKGSILRRPLFLTPGSVRIGEKVFIWKGCRIEGVNNYAGQSFNPEIEIQDGVTIQQNLHLTCANHIIIGRNTAIAANVSITDIHHPYDDIHVPIEQQPLKVRSVKIGEDCKIYNNAVILPGTVIGRHCTIGANSVVSGSIPDYSVCAGVPAKIVKRYNFEKQFWERT